MSRIVSVGLLVVLGCAAFLLLQPDAPLDGAPSGEPRDDNREPALVVDGPLKVEPGTSPALEGTGQADAPAPAVKGATVKGRVIDVGTGKGIPGVRLYAACRGEGPRPKYPGVEAQTDEEGHFAIEGLRPGTWMYLPYHREYAHPFTSALFRASDSTKDPWRRSSDAAWKEAYMQRLVAKIPETLVARGPVTIGMFQGPAMSGRVVGPDGKGVPNVQIRPYVLYYGPWLELQAGLQEIARAFTLDWTDEDGRFSVRCFAEGVDGVRLGAVHPGLLSRWTKPIKLEDRTGIELRLFRPATIQGRVVLRDGTGVADAYIEAPVEDDWIYGEPSTRSLKDGTFELSGVPPGVSELHARTTDGDKADGTLSIEPIREGETRPGITLTISSDRWLRGVLVDAQGNPIANESVSAYLPGEDEDDLDSDTTDEEGKFRLEIESKEAFELWLLSGDRDERLREDLRIPSPELRIVTTPTPRNRIELRVLDPSGAPVPKFSVEVQTLAGGGYEYERGKDGRASVLAMGAPPYRLRIHRFKDGKRRKLDYPDHGLVIRGPFDRPIEVRLSKLASFFGRVVDHEGKPVPGVGLRYDDREISLDEQGHFRFRAHDAKTKRIRKGEVILPEGYRNLTYALTLRPGRFQDIRIKGGGRPISGRVVFKGTGKASLGDLGIEVRWTSVEDPPHEDEEDGLEIETDADGRFLLYALPADAQVTLRLVASSLRRAGLIEVTPAQVVASGAKDIVFEVTRGGVIAGRLEGPGVADLDETRVRMQILAWHGFPYLRHASKQPTRADPTFEIRGLQPGRHAIALVGAKHLLAWRGGIQTGQRDVVLHVPRSNGEIHGRITSAATPAEERHTVTLFREDGSRFAVESDVDKDGRFRFQGLDRNQTYTLHVEAHGVPPEEGKGGLAAVKRGVSPGTTVALALRASALIQGKLVRSPGDEDVPLIMAIQRDVIVFAKRRQKDGSFEIDGLEPGTCDVIVIGEGLTRRKVVRGVKVGRKDLVIKLD